MLRYRKFTLSSLASLGLWLALTTASPAQMSHDATSANSSGFRRIEQPIWTKALVTAGGLGLIGLELWWFVLGQPKSSRAKRHDGVQEITITVDGGYEPSQVVVQAGQLVRLNFYRTDPSSCLEEIRLPDFRIAKALPVNQTTAIEFTPSEPGRYEFTCGMNMFRGTVEAVASSPKSEAANLAPAAKVT
ncbi:MAG: cupredoxin domain-containing protein [Cyanobacteria bacterium P01_A01_bin.123]